MSCQTPSAKLQHLIANTIRGLSMDGVQKANSGHPGLPLGAADYAAVLWTRHLRYNPEDPGWANRDRFVLSAGHGSMLLYSLLNLAGFDVPLEQLKAFRQWGSITPGHPEHGLTPGVEATTGPLGQGVGNGIGMALASMLMAARFNRPGFPLIDHHVYALVSDGDLMEGIASEAASLAGHLKLGNLIYLYDDNHITIEGGTDLAFSEDVGKRFEAYDWHVQHVDGHDPEAVDAAIEAAKAVADRPSLIVCRTHIAYGSPSKHDTSGAHGEPLGVDEVKASKEHLGIPLEPDFYVPQEVADWFAAKAECQKAQAAKWQEMLAAYRTEHPDLGAQWDAMWSREVPADIAEQLIAAMKPDDDATRNSGGAALQLAAKLVPALIGGSADLAPSTKTLIKNCASIGACEFGGANLHFGIREHAMGAICNGMAYYGSFIPYGATFAIFSDYMRPSMRLAALTHLQVIYVLTHDSIFVGEDGPTHEPIEHASSFRAMPNMYLMRPGDSAETAACWGAALLRKHGPSALFLTRQKLPELDRTKYAPAIEALKGGYVVSDCEKAVPDVIIIGTGSELHLGLAAQDALAAKGVAARVVSMPCVELFEDQSAEYKASVLPAACTKRVAIEAGASWGWHKYVGLDGLIIGIDRFGASAPYKVLGEKFGFTADQVIAKVDEWL
jgi:transketolase